MQKVWSDLVDHVKATKLPTKPSANESEALVKAKAQLAAHGLALTPDQTDAQSSDPSTKEGPLPLQVDSNPKPPKRAKSGKNSTEEEARKLSPKINWIAAHGGRQFSMLKIGCNS